MEGVVIPQESERPTSSGRVAVRGAPSPPAPPPQRATPPQGTQPLAASPEDPSRPPGSATGARLAAGAQERLARLQRLDAAAQEKEHLDELLEGYLQQPGRPGMGP
uniref:Uncharacterized protein n=1 Tax=Haptolina brevifila TaxID=156173 RepID=A0A7S2HXL5_9EUKA|mmetsp:Transcript_58760/g.116734  ORF Transcript_58760/g.116734 Transcript_58760/m.116734 type:complete len:106 (+) Transcript_58760:189-506(+)